ncbi:MAG TPA: hypothetical protein VLA93_05820 [Pyrinomonadaceae bacterium]|nr:hypothetical protein [Pyrinomonadaceae bacterium]
MDLHRSSERGAARLKLLIFLIIAAAIGYGLYLYVPVAYQAYLFKDWMQHTVDIAGASGYQPTWVNDQLKKSLAEYSVPPDAVITTATRDNRVEARVQYIRTIEFPGYTYQYDFDYTARSTSFLFK